MKKQNLVRLARQEEGLSLEFKRSTGELRQALETLCGFLNTKGGRIIIGVGPHGEIRGQQVSDQTLQEIAQAFERFEPPFCLRSSVSRCAVDWKHCPFPWNQTTKQFHSPSRGGPM